MNNVNAGPDNAEIARGIGSDMAWGATFGAVPGGPSGQWWGPVVPPCKMWCKER